MPIDYTNLDDIADVTLDEFKDAYRNGDSIAANYYTELAAQAVASGNTNIENYADSAYEVVTDSSPRGNFSNEFSENVAGDQGIDFSVGSDAWLEVQYELMQQDLDFRKNTPDGELDWEDTKNIHENAYTAAGVPPEAFSMYTPLELLGDVDPALAQSLFEDLIEDSGFWDNLFIEGAGIDFLADLTDQVNLDYYKWLGDALETVLLNPEIPLGTAAENFRDFIDAVFGPGGFELPHWLSLPDIDILPNLPEWFQGLIPDVDGENFFRLSSPLVIDLDRSGTIDLTNVDGSDIHFDFWGDGFSEQTAWVAATDGLLVHDLDQDGLIEGMDELFGSNYPLGYMLDNFSLMDTENGFEKLAVWDLAEFGGNGDGVIDANDAVWSELQVWQDLNQDGISQAGELLTLDQVGLQSIDIGNYELDSFNGFPTYFTRKIEGNTITHSSSVTWNDGGTSEIVDAWFNNDLRNTFYTEDFSLDVRVLYLPTLRGYGNLPDLHIAMSLDNQAGGLLDQMIDFVTARNFEGLFSDFSGVQDDVRDILFNWAGIDLAAIADNPAYKEHGVFGELPEYYFLRKLAGQDSEYLETWFDSSPFLPVISDGMESIFDSWAAVLKGMTARLIFQSGGSALFEDGVNYNPFTDTFEGTFALSQTALDQLETDATGHADVEGYWHAIASYLDATMGIENLSATELGWLEAAVTDSSVGALSWDYIVDTLSDFTQDGTSGDDTINGTRWDDVLGAEQSGSNGNDVINGHDGNDKIYGGNGDDILDGGAGNDILFGGDGNDIYKYDSGHDVFFEASSYSADTDIIEFGSGINLSDISLHFMRRDANFTSQFIIDVEGRGTISIEPDVNGPLFESLMDELYFANGTSVDIYDMDVTYHGSDDSETVSANAWSPNAGATVYIYGYGGDDTLTTNLGSVTNVLDGGEGNDLLRGGASDDIYIASTGSDSIDERQGGVDTIRLSEGITLNDLQFYHVFSTGISSIGNDAKIVIDGVGDITILNQYSNNTDRYVERLEFYDGTIVDISTLLFTRIGTDGNDSFSDTTSDPQIDNIYLFGKGIDTIYETLGGNDKVIFEEGVTLADLTIYRSDGTAGDYLVIEDQNGNQMRIRNQFDEDPNNPGQPDNGGFIEQLVFSDGTTWSSLNFEIETHGTDVNDFMFGAEAGDLSQDDTIYGYGGNDQIDGLGGNDLIYGGEGNDNLNGRDGNDTLYGGTGDDGLTGGDGDDMLYGDEGNDTLNGNDGADIMYGGSGNDTMRGHAGDDQLYGGDGDDHLYGDQFNTTSDDILSGGAGNDFLFGYGGNDTYVYTSGNDVITSENYNSIDKIVLPDGITVDDLLFWRDPTVSNGFYTLNITVGSLGVVKMEGQIDGNYELYNHGIETLEFSDGSTINLREVDVITVGNSSNNTLKGVQDSAGDNDTIYGFAGDDTLLGYGGNDTLVGGTGNDTLNGGDGIDTASYFNAASGVTVDLSAGTASGGDGNDTLIDIENITGSAYADVLTGDASDNVINGAGGNDTISGGAGNDTLSYAFAVAAVAVDLSINIAVGGDGTDTLSGMENVIGSDYADTLKGASDANILQGGLGDDTLLGNLGSDKLYGQEGDDILLFSNDQELDILPGGGSQSMMGFGGGFSSQSSSFGGGTGTDVFVSNDLYDGGSGTDTLVMTDSDEYIYLDGGLYSHAGGSGPQLVDIEIIEAGAGDDVIDLSSSQFTYGDVTIYGEGGKDTLTGNAGNDTLDGGVSLDTLYGGAGNDTLIGGKGSDVLYGGAGADTFAWLSGDKNNANAVDDIMDFNLAQGDKLDISDILDGYDPLTDAITDFVQITDNGTDSVISVDVDGGGNNFVTLATIFGTTGLTDEDALVASGNLIVV